MVANITRVGYLGLAVACSADLLGLGPSATSAHGDQNFHIITSALLVEEV